MKVIIDPPDLLATTLALLDRTSRGGRRRRRNNAEDGPNRRRRRVERRRVPRDSRRAVQEHGQRRRGNVPRQGQPDDAVPDLGFGSSRRRIRRVQSPSSAGGPPSIGGDSDAGGGPAQPVVHAPAMRSFKLLQDCPASIDFIFQTYRPLVNKAITIFVPVVFDFVSTCTRNRNEGKASRCNRASRRRSGHGHGADQGETCRDLQSRSQDSPFNRLTLLSLQPPSADNVLPRLHPPLLQHCSVVLLERPLRNRRPPREGLPLRSRRDEARLRQRH